MSGEVFQDRSRSARVYVTCADTANDGISADDTNAHRIIRRAAEDENIGIMRTSSD
jgi:hypothetical protein